MTAATTAVAAVAPVATAVTDTVAVAVAVEEANPVASVHKSFFPLGGVVDYKD